MFQQDKPYYRVQKRDAIFAIKVTGKMKLQGIRLRYIFLADWSYDLLVSPLDTAQVSHSMITTSYTPRMRISVFLNRVHVLVCSDFSVSGVCTGLSKALAGDLLPVFRRVDARLS